MAIIGGGTGTYQVLTGLKRYPLEISAVISMCDTGGSTGRLRKELGILPPGDVRRAIIALSDLPFAQKTLEEVFDFRFEKGQGLAGHSLGNILLAALTQITGSMDKAITEAARILNASGKIYPVTLNNTNLVAILENGKRVFGETKIDMRDFDLKFPIKKVYLTPKARIFKDAAQAISQADVIVLGPGDLFTSIVPVLLVEGVNKAILASKAKLVYVVNLMTKRGETDNFTATDFVAVIKDYLGEAQKKLSHVFVNKNINYSKTKISRWYKRYGSRPVVNDLVDNSGLTILERNFIDETTLFRHQPEKLAKAIVSLI